MHRINMIDLKREIAYLGKELRESIEKSFEDTMFINGPRVKEFENNAAKYLGVEHAISCANGTEAIHLGLLSMGIKAGDEVITTPFTFFATAEACEYIGAKPVFVDIDEKTFNIDVNKIERVINSKTKAIVPVHVFGEPVDMHHLIPLAKANKIKVLEDCAQSFGAHIDGKMTGTFGDVGTFSFYPTKNLGAYGDAGMVITNDSNVASLMKQYKEHGSTVRYHHDIIGYNSRLDDIQAAILLVKLKYIDQFNAKRREIASKYIKSFEGIIKYQHTLPQSYHTYHQFTIRVNNRSELISVLDKNDVATAIFYPIACHMQKSLAYLGYKKGDLPITDMLTDEVLSLPINPFMKDEEVDKIIELVLKNAR